MKNFFFLGIAILFEIIATSALKKSEQFTQLIPSIITIIGYFAAFYFLSFAIRTIPVGIAYAIWSGVGIVLITIIGAVFFKQIPDLPAIIGLALIMIGVVVINVFSKTTVH
ncbi:small multidrug resistance pump [Flavobacterium aquidurense]|uniref:QacE family quaternary ammonium compound efflux SMR transporter n=1 Tax=Flavobacterium frigidimaris TaxID=262320 RepID=A0ABX4BT52_FLAFR|nr:SMR family transporter [Flavobacterium frigidimaris]OXA79991.1 QacE family quaternary ammonium compound efflux SMR transporter [Flavobacterium frigidimaris]SDZ41492.1 small multidrug resistance pump [Flavobacterium aquidurense]